MAVRLILAAALVALLGAAGSARAGAAADGSLVASVGSNDSFNISLADSAGNAVTHLDPGTYTLTVHDKSQIHNFHIEGPGVDALTEIPFVGDQTFTITLTDGTYFFQCDAHAAQMKGKFTVGAVAAPPPKAPPVKLSGSIGPGTKISLGPLGSAAAGNAVLTVNDRTAADGFRLSGPGVRKSTGISFRGHVTWKVTLKAGKYFFGSVRHPLRRKTFTISS